MGTIRINLPGVLNASQLLHQSKNIVDDCLDTVNQYYNLLDKRISQNSGIAFNKKKIELDLSESSKKISQIYSTVNNDVTLYNNVENVIRNNTDNMPKIGQIAAPAVSTGFAVGTLFDSKDVKNITDWNGSGIGDANISVKAPDPVSPTVVGDYLKKVSNAEYARLCSFCNDTADDSDPAASFLKKLKSLPEGDPMRDIDKDHINYVRSDFSGLTTIIINDDNGNALVIFAGTNPKQVSDLITDAEIAGGHASAQSKEANMVIGAMSAKYSNIVVTGHSLGGYLATSVALNNDSVSKCIAFDPPGRYDVGLQIITNKKNFSKITTYEANGSVVSAVGTGSGNVIKIDVEQNWAGPAPNHGIRQICDALGGNETIENTWKYPDNHGSTRSF